VYTHVLSAVQILGNVGSQCCDARDEVQTHAEVRSIIECCWEVGAHLDLAGVQRRGGLPLAELRQGRSAPVRARVRPRARGGPTLAYCGLLHNAREPPSAPLLLAVRLPGSLC
jgi:hypothetical protein